MDRQEDVTASRPKAAATAADERDRAVGAMQSRQDWLRLILESATDFAIVATDLEGSITDWNTGAQNILGWPAPEILGRSADVIWTQEDRAAGLPAAEMRIARERGRAHDERWHVRRDGGRFWATGEMMPLRDAAGTLLGYLKILRDRTDERRASEALKQSEARLRRAQEAGGVGLFSVDLEHNRVTGTPQYCRIFGLPECDSLPAEAIERLLIAEDAPGLILGPVQRQSGTTPLSAEYRIRRADTGEERWIARKAEYEWGADGRPARLHGAVQDVTERKAAQRAVEESAAQLRAFAQALPNQLWTAPPDGLLDWFNDRVYEYSGAAPGELDGQGWAQIVHPDDLPAAAARWPASLASGDPYEVEFRIRRADGAYRWHIVRAVPIRDTAGAITRWVGTNTDIHERKLAEAESTRDRNRIWALSQELMLVCDFEGMITAVNPSATRSLGWTEEEMRGRGLAEFVHADDLRNTVAEVARLSQGLATLAFETRCRTADGRYRLIAWTAVPDAGRIHAVGRDITEERAIARDRDRIWTLSPVLKLVGRLDGHILAVNPSWTRTLGWHETETVGRNVTEFLAPEEQADGRAGLTRLAAGIPVIELQSTFLTKSGERRRISWTTVPEDGTLYGFGRDITAETRAAEALSASRSERERIWTSTNDLMGTAGADGFLKSVNPAWSRLLGYSETELLSRPLFDLIDPAQHAHLARALDRLARGEAVTDFEDHLIHQDGRRSLIAWSAEPVGDVFYIVGRDVTEQRAAEEQLRQSQKMEAVGQLTGGLAHDFNNLLTGIAGSLELLQARVAQGRYGTLERYISAAQGAASRAAALTHRLLAFSRRQTLDPRPIQANRLIAGMEELIRRTVGPEIRLETVLAVGLWPTLCDPNQLESALLNLCINARDAMPDGGRLTIETANTWLDARGARERDMQPGQYVALCVTDTGTGMPPDVVARAFDPFFTTKPTGQGTGLGLSMVYGFAKQSGGQVRIYSEVEQGTTMRLYLPRFWGEASAEEAEAEVTEAPRAQHGETVLVVDDEPTLRMLIAEVLGELGYAGIEAADGSAGLRVLQSDTRVDLLITDVGLPGGLNGRQLADAGRQSRPALKVLFITGYAENAVIGNGHLEPGMQVMTKPFAMEVLASRIKAMIGGG